MKVFCFILVVFSLDVVSSLIREGFGLPTTLRKRSMDRVHIVDFGQTNSPVKAKRYIEATQEMHPVEHTSQEFRFGEPLPHLAVTQKGNENRGYEKELEKLAFKNEDKRGYFTSNVDRKSFERSPSQQKGKENKQQEYLEANDESLTQETIPFEEERKIQPSTGDTKEEQDRPLTPEDELRNLRPSYEDLEKNGDIHQRSHQGGYRQTSPEEELRNLRPPAEVLENERDVYKRSHQDGNRQISPEEELRNRRLSDEVLENEREVHQHSHEDENRQTSHELRNLELRNLLSMDNKRNIHQPAYERNNVMKREVSQTENIEVDYEEKDRKENIFNHEKDLNLKGLQTEASKENEERKLHPVANNYLEGGEREFSLPPKAEGELKRKSEHKLGHENEVKEWLDSTDEEEDADAEREFDSANDRNHDHKESTKKEFNQPPKIEKQRVEKLNELDAQKEDEDKVRKIMANNHKKELKRVSIDSEKEQRKISDLHREELRELHPPEEDEEEERDPVYDESEEMKRQSYSPTQEEGLHVEKEKGLEGLQQDDEESEERKREFHGLDYLKSQKVKREENQSDDLFMPENYVEEEKEEGENLFHPPSHESGLDPRKNYRATKRLLYASALMKPNRRDDGNLRKKMNADFAAIDAENSRPAYMVFPFTAERTIGNHEISDENVDQFKEEDKTKRLIRYFNKFRRGDLEKSERRNAFCQSCCSVEKCWMIYEEQCNCT